jgi:2-polyprenyl-3-methyl-5-hydroxy-6-metoxy-1,4-benzoquinol methylase
MSKDFIQCYRTAKQLFTNFEPVVLQYADFVFKFLSLIVHKNMIKVACDLCGSTSYKVKYKIDVSENNLRFYRYARNIPNKEQMTGWQLIVECNECELIYTNPRFTTEELELVYSSDKILGGNWRDFRYLFNKNLPDELQGLKKSNSYSSILYDWKFEIIEKYAPNLPKGIKVIDIGCGDGKFVNDALKRGYDAYGIDLSPDRIQQGKKLYGLDDVRLKTMNIDDFSNNEKFDVIVMWDVFEHVESPSFLLKSLKKISHKSTVIYVLTMSIDSITYKMYKRNWNYINPPQHLHYFSHATIKKMFIKNGFDLVGVEMDDSKNKNLVHLGYRIIVGVFNNWFFKLYTRNSIAKNLLKPFQNKISDERMQKRLENLHPGKYLGRYHDNFVFVGKLIN